MAIRFNDYKKAPSVTTPQFAAAAAAKGRMEAAAKAQANALRSQNMMGAADIYNAGMGDRTPIGDYLFGENSTLNKTGVEQFNQAGGDELNRMSTNQFNNPTAANNTPMEMNNYSVDMGYQEPMNMNMDNYSADMGYEEPINATRQADLATGAMPDQTTANELFMQDAENNMLENMVLEETGAEAALETGAEAALETGAEAALETGANAALETGANAALETGANAALGAGAGGSSALLASMPYLSLALMASRFL